MFKKFAFTPIGKSLRYLQRRMDIFKYNRKNKTYIYSISIPKAILAAKGIKQYASIGRNVIFVGTGKNVIVGEYTYIGSGFIENVIIGKYCSIANNVCLGPGEHNMNHISTYPIFNRVMHINKNNEFINKTPTVIGNDVWIGQGVTVIQGVNVGDGAVIAAGAIVTKDIAPYSVCGGIPAKHIKFRFSPEVVNELLILKWWDKPQEWIYKNAEVFQMEDITAEKIKRLT